MRAGQSINQSVFLFYVCSHRGDIRQQQQQQQKHTKNQQIIIIFTNFPTEL